MSAYIYMIRELHSSYAYCVQSSTLAISVQKTAIGRTGMSIYNHDKITFLISTS